MWCALRSTNPARQTGKQDCVSRRTPRPQEAIPRRQAGRTVAEAASDSSPGSVTPAECHSKALSCGRWGMSSPHLLRVTVSGWRSQGARWSRGPTGSSKARCAEPPSPVSGRKEAPRADQSDGRSQETGVKKGNEGWKALLELGAAWMPLGRKPGGRSVVPGRGDIQQHQPSLAAAALRASRRGSPRCTPSHHGLGTSQGGSCAPAQCWRGRLVPPTGVRPPAKPHAAPAGGLAAAPANHNPAAAAHGAVSWTA